jgi:hypothetical protein
MSNKQREALEAAKQYFKVRNLGDNAAIVLAQIETALAEPEQEPSYYATQHGGLIISAKDMEALGLNKRNYVPLYPSPQPREWQELSESDVYKTHRGCSLEIYKAISAALRSVNGL